MSHAAPAQPMANASGHGQESCFHCGLPVPAAADFTREIDGAHRLMCCPGCCAAAELIMEEGLGAYYRRRDSPPLTPRVTDADARARMRGFDELRVQQAFVVPCGDGLAATFSLEGVRCAACAWLIEEHLSRRAGVVAARVNLFAHRLRLEWQPEQTRLSELMEAVEALGYRIEPFEPDREELALKRQQRAALRRLGVSGLAMMQVMMFAVALYAGAIEGMEPVYRALLRWVSFAVATVVIAHPARPFFSGAWRDLRAFRPGMDVPIALALAGAYGASAWATVRGSGEVYFDSVCMFTFFLTLARYVESRARQRSGAYLRRLAKRVPATANRQAAGDSAPEIVPVADLEVGDQILIRPGESIPVDAKLVDATASVSEALLTGEEAPQRKGRGDRLLAGCQNLDQALVAVVEQTAGTGTLSTLTALIDRAQSEKPPVAELADLAARWFVSAVIVAAACVAAVWWTIAPERAFSITLAVLVATCPCALSLATPAALATASNALAARGFLITRGHVLAALARINRVVLDKTGTVTTGHPQLRVAIAEASDADLETLVSLACALEEKSDHPIARAFRCDALPDDMAGVERERVRSQVDALRGRLEASRIHAGAGVSGELAGLTYRLGEPEWAMEITAASPSVRPPSRNGSWLLLATATGPVAWFALAAGLRPGARRAVRRLQEQGITVDLLSGDPSQEAVHEVALALGTDAATAGARPETKLHVVRARQEGGDVVAAVGDGLNDAPLLGGAQISIAMGGGSDLARVNSDAVLLHDDLELLGDAVAWARKTRRIIRQNLTWAVLYNAAALSLAALGHLPPWGAALGMSVSSLLVVGNALRLSELKS